MWLFLCGKAPWAGRCTQGCSPISRLIVSGRLSHGNSIVAAITLMMLGIVASRDQVYVVDPGIHYQIRIKVGRLAG